MKRILFGILFALACGPVSAQSIKVPASWDALAAKADEVVNINLDRTMLRFASKFMDDEDDVEGKQLISKLNGIYVRSLEFRNPGEFTEASLEPIRAQLQGPAWSRVVAVESRADKQRVSVYVKAAGNQTIGMVILAEEPNQLTFVDLDGPINPDDIDGLSGNFGIPKDIHVRSKRVDTVRQSEPEAPVHK